MSSKCIFMSFILLLLVWSNSAFGTQQPYCSEVPGGPCTTAGQCRTLIWPPPYCPYPTEPNNCVAPGTRGTGGQVPSPESCVGCRDGVEGRQEDWRGFLANPTSDGLWSTVENWVDKHNTTVRPPDCYMFAAIEPKPPFPHITGAMGNIRSSALCVSPWRWTEALDFELIIEADACLIDAGQCIGISNLRSPMNDTDYGIINMYGGTMFTSTETLKFPYYESHVLEQTAGLWVGGGNNGTENAPGRLSMYGGLIIVPRIGLYHGVVNLYGGTLKGTSTSTADLIIRTMYAKTKINVAGGTLLLKGNRVTEVDSYKTAGRIVPYNSRGASSLNTAYNAGTGYTTVTATPDLGPAWDPTPTNGQNELPMVPIPPDVNLPLSTGASWKPGDWVRDKAGDVNGHRVYLGTIYADVCDAQCTDCNATAVTATSIYRGAFDVCTYDMNSRYASGLPAKSLKFNTRYYWRIDEVNDACNASPWKGVVWHFNTVSGKAFNPHPADNSSDIFDINTPSLKWTKGKDANDTNGHKVYFGTDFNSVRDATTATPIYRGQQTPASYPLSSLKPDYTLVPGNSYYWRIDEVNNNPVGSWPGDVWTFVFTKEYYIDAFDVNTSWKTTYLASSCTGTNYGGGATWVWSAGDKNMVLSYNNTGSTSYDKYSEARWQYNITDANIGCDWTAASVPSGTPKLLYVSYNGLASNAADPIYDRMYVVIKDANSHLGPVVYNPDGIAQQREMWQDWRIPLSDLNTAPDVNLAHIRYLVIGFGQRCNKYASPNPGGIGTVTFDNIRLSQPICEPRYGPASDFYDDCFVDEADLDLFVNDWLLTGKTLHYPDACAPTVGPVLWYDFNETDGNLVHNHGSATNADANVNIYVDGKNKVGRTASTWDTGGRINGCINLTYGSMSFVNVPPAVLATFASPTGPNAITFTFWVNWDINSVPTTKEPAVISAADAPADAVEVIKVLCPTPKPPVQAGPAVSFEMGQLATTNVMKVGDFGGRWNHYALVKDADANVMTIYHNGELIKTLSVAIDRPLLSKTPIVFKIGARYGDNVDPPFGPWGPWPGKIDDFRMYDYALNANQIAWIAGGNSAAQFDVPLVEPTNFKSSTPEIVNFGDYATFAGQWLNEKLWPQ